MKRMESKFNNTSSKLALFAVMTALTVVTNLIMVPMPQPLAEYDLSPVLIYSLGVLMDPILACATIATAMGIGVGYKMITFGFPPVFVFGAMFVRGIEAAFISALVHWRKDNNSKAISWWEITAMALGAIWETLGFFSLDWILFGPGMAMIVLATIVDIVFVPIAVVVVAAVRGRLGIKRFT